jgi:hypothetical protein
MRGCGRRSWRSTRRQPARQRCAPAAGDRRRRQAAATGDEAAPPPPFIWNDDRRARIRAGLDARIARLYGVSRDDLRYILDPHDVEGPDFPGETFRVLKEKELRQYGEYRTRRLTLEAFSPLIPPAPFSHKGRRGCWGGRRTLEH